jgi:hypothetical protein
MEEQAYEYVDYRSEQRKDLMKMSKEHLINLYFEELDRAIYKNEENEKFMKWVVGVGMVLILLSAIGLGFLFRM